MGRDAVAALVFLATVGAMPAVALTGSVALGVPLGAAATLVTSAIGASVATLTGTSVVLWVVGAALATNCLAALAIAGRSAGHTRWGSAVSVRGTALLVWYGVPALALLMLFRPAPIWWDARSIWWFHASWFRAGGDAVRSGLTNPAVAFSHPDYPPGDPAAIAALWSITGSGKDLPLAATTTAALTALAVVVIAMVLVIEHRDSLGSDVLVTSAALLLVVAAVHLGQGYASGGYVDVLCSALLVGALAAFVEVDDLRAAMGAGALALAGASVTKSEGLLFGAMIVMVAVVAARGRRRAVLIFGSVALAPAVLWQVAVWSAGAPANSDLGGTGVDILVRLGRPDFWDRLVVAGPHVAREVYLIVLPAVLVLGLLAATTRGRWRTSTQALPLRTPAALVAAAVLSAVALAFTYALGVTDLSRWVPTSLERVSSTPKLFALAGLVAMIPATLELLRSHDPQPRRAEAEVGSRSGAA
jgi:hypothetical protein